MESDKPKKVIGYKQSLQSINDRRVKKAYLAQDVEEDMKKQLVFLLKKNGIDYEFVSTKHELGRDHGIKVGASIVCLLN